MGSEHLTRRGLLGTGVALGAAAPALAAAAEPPPSPRLVETLDSGWRFHAGAAPGAERPDFDDAAWEAVSLPHTWNLRDAFGERKGYYRGVGWYRLRLPASLLRPGSAATLRIRAANQAAKVYVDGRLAGEHLGGHTAFTVDLPAFEAGGRPPVVAVAVDNSADPRIPPVAGDFNIWGGLYRGVELVQTAPVHFAFAHGGDGIAVDTPSVSAASAQVRVRGAVRNTGPRPRRVSVACEVLDPQGAVVARQAQALTVAPGAAATFALDRLAVGSPRLWSPETPVLYRVRTRLESGGAGLDEVHSPLGLRSFSFTGERGLILNGAPYPLVGAARHQDFEGVGLALTADLNRVDVRRVKAMGGNFIRLGHQVVDEVVLEECDRLGLIVQEAISVVSDVGDDPGFGDAAESSLRELIAQHRNHPSILLWELMNEPLIITVFANKDPAARQARAAKVTALARRLHAISKAEDPARSTIIACHHAEELYNTSGLADVPDVLGWNLYYGWYQETVADFGPFLDEQHRRYPKRPIIITEYGAGSDLRLHTLKPQAYDFTPEYQQFALRSLLTDIRARPFIAGSSVWVLADFGVNNREESMPRVNNKGLLKYDRTPKDVYFYYQAALSKAPMAHIAVRDWPRRKLRSAGTTAVQRVDVFANTTEVSLTLNGAPLGSRPVTNAVASFDVPFMNGANVLEAVAGAARDAATVEVDLAPLKPAAARHVDIALNAGSDCWFESARSHAVHEPDQPYAPGGWGHVGGKAYSAIPPRPGTLADAYGTEDDPLFQTSRVGVQAYRFDVPPGDYQLELGFMEPPRSTGTTLGDIIVSADERAKGLAGTRMFDVRVDGRTVLRGLDVAAEVGGRSALVRRVQLSSRGNGVRVDFQAARGEPMVSTVRLRGLA